MANYSVTHYSATQVVSPAIERTKRFLYEPFRLGRFLKLTLVATVTEGGMATCNFNSSVPGKSSGKGGPSGIPTIPDWHMPQLHWPGLPMLLAGIAVVLLVGILVGVVIAYLLVRLRFAYFDCVLNKQSKIAPAWARYHHQAMRFLGLSWCVALAWLLILAPIVYWLFERYKPLFQAMGSAKPPVFVDFLPLIGIVVVLGIGFTLIGYSVNAVLGCFVLPRMALDDASIGESLEDVWSDLQAEPGAFALFLLLRVLLTIAASLIALIALGLVGVGVVLIGLILALIVKAISQTLLVTLGIPALILVVLLAIPVIIGASGTIGTFKRNYAILFYAARYPEMAMILWPPLPPPPPPPLPSSEVWPTGQSAPDATSAEGP